MTWKKRYSSKDCELDSRKSIVGHIHQGRMVEGSCAEGSVLCMPSQSTFWCECKFTEGISLQLHRLDWTLPVCLHPFSRSSLSVSLLCQRYSLFSCSTTCFVSDSFLPSVATSRLRSTVTVITLWHSPTHKKRENDSLPGNVWFWAWREEEIYCQLYETV